MSRWGWSPVLVRDLTDTMYNPARPPYVSHEAGTQLVVEFVEKFGSLVQLQSETRLADGGPATVSSDELLRATSA
jgi:hypothetical protein